MADRRKWNYGVRRGLKRKQTLADSPTNQGGVGSSYNSSKPPSKDTPMSERALPNPYRLTDSTRRPRQSGRRKRSY